MRDERGESLKGVTLWGGRYKEKKRRDNKTGRERTRDGCYASGWELKAIGSERGSKMERKREVQRGEEDKVVTTASAFTGRASPPCSP